MERSHHFAGCAATANTLWLCIANCKCLHLAVYCFRNWYYTTEFLWQSDVQKGSIVSAVCGQCAVQHSCELTFSHSRSQQQVPRERDTKRGGTINCAPFFRCFYLVAYPLDGPWNPRLPALRIGGVCKLNHVECHDVRLLCGYCFLER